MRRVPREKQQVSPRRRVQDENPRSQGALSSARHAVCRPRCRTGRCVAALLLFVALSVQLWVRISIVGKSYDLERLRGETLQADSELRELRVVYAVQAQPATVLSRSRSSLGLEPPQPQQVRRVAFSML